MTNTPKNRKELEDILQRAGRRYYNAAGMGNHMLHYLEAHGVRLVPVEATEEMVNELYFSDDLIWERSDESKWIAWTDWPRAYRVTLSASPFRPDTGDEG